MLSSKQAAFIILGILILSKNSSAIKCYVCEGLDHLCTIGLLGEKTECPPETKNCYKSWTVETAPKTKRKCGSKNVLENECRDVLFGQNSMLACYCDEHDYCNNARHLSIPFSLIISLPILRFVY